MSLLRNIVTALLTLSAICSMAHGDLLISLDIAPIPSADEVYPDPPDWSGKRVLHIGDSHVSAGFTSRLGRLFREAGARYSPQMWIGSRSRSAAPHPRASHQGRSAEATFSK